MTASWRALHLHDHENLQTLLSHFILPELGQLIERQSIHSFFFVRFALGGPHVRLRLLPRDEETAPIVLRTTDARASRFFVERPSCRAWSRDAIDTHDRAILASDGNERHPGEIPDNVSRRAPFIPETWRYGGQGLYQSSVDYFAISSVVALVEGQRLGLVPRSRVLVEVALLLWLQAWSCARDTAEFERLLGWCAEGDARFPGAFARADETARTHGPALWDLLVAQVFDNDEVAGEAASTTRLLRDGGRALNRALHDAGPDDRRRVLSSQLHMTANRLGLRNAEEVYVGRLLRLLFAERGEVGPDDSGAAPTVSLLATRQKALAFLSSHTRAVPSAC